MSPGEADGPYVLFGVLVLSFSSSPGEASSCTTTFKWNGDGCHGLFQRGFLRPFSFVRLHANRSLRGYARHAGSRSGSVNPTPIGLGTPLVDPAGNEGGQTHAAEDDDLDNEKVFHDVVGRPPLPQRPLMFAY